jgi:ectoine hydroxylase-related dioxygenase (phytanoyl-CoA dioxygenase family)
MTPLTLTTSARTLSPEQVAQYHRDGYLIVEDVFDAAAIDALRAETTAICRGERGTIAGLPPMLPGDTDDAIMQRILCIHFPHKLSPLMLDTVRHPTIAAILTQLIAPDVKCMQSMLFVKSAGKPGQAWHQDEDFIPTRDRSLTGAWIALDDATIENGCLWMIPGSHQAGVLWELRPQDSADFDCTDESIGFPYSDADAVPAEVRAGTVVFFNGYLLHRSLPNTAKAGYRRALVNHYMSASSLLPWSPPKPGEYIATLDFRDIVMVAGRDPYAWKGTVDVMQPKIRPSREGGCKWDGAELEVQADTDEPDDDHAF